MAESITTNDSNDNSTPSIPQWRQLALKHREHQLSLIPPEWRLKTTSLPTTEKNTIPLIEAHLTPTEREITSLTQTISSLHQAIKSKRYTATQITQAYCHRAALLQQVTSCLTEIFFPSALETAATQDTHFTRTGTLLGPLHGIPISIKDNQDITGIDSTLGWVGLISRPATTDSPAVETIRRAGGILYCKTNIPQSLMMSDSYNHLYGQSVNSLNHTLISGGSSGGEGALVAGGGNIVGIGTDIGGSVRIPATLQGVYGLSPSIGRVGNRESGRRDKHVVPPVAGPLARDIDTLEAFMQAYSDAAPWTTDPVILPIPWRKDIVDSYATKKRLRVGYVVDDGMVRCQPPIERAVRETVSTFEKAGHEVVSFDSIAQKYHSKGYDLWLRAVLADGGERFAALSALVPGEPEPLIKGMLVGTPATKLDVAGRMALTDEIYAFQREYLRVWNESGIDVLIMPVTQWVGLRPKVWVEADMYVGYTSLWNLMDWCSLCVPAVTVDKARDCPDASWVEYLKKVRSFSDEFNWKGYNVEEVEGMPVGVQIVSGRLGEEKAVGIARLLANLK